MIKIYISGRIGGDTIDDETRDKFHRAACKLKAAGFQVVDPTHVQTQSLIRAYASQLDLPIYDAALLYDLQDIADCEAVYFLNDWVNSPGARCEHAFARATGKRIFYQGSEPFSYRSVSADLYDE